VNNKKTADAITPFQRRVYKAVKLIPRGKVATYSTIAEYIGCASAQAVGQALKKNPFAPQVPCHRVISSTLAVGGFQGEGAGNAVRRKLNLLNREGVSFVNGRLADRTHLVDQLPQVQSVRFGIITDLHSGDRPSNNGRHYRKSPAKLRDTC